MFDEIIHQLAQIANQEADDSLAKMALQGDDSDDDEPCPDTLPVLPLKNMVLFPKVLAPISVGRPKSIAAIETAKNECENWIFVVAQRHEDTEEPTQDDLYMVGTIAKIVRTIENPDSAPTVVIQGRQRAALVALATDGPFLIAQLHPLETAPPVDQAQLDAAISGIREAAERIILSSPDIPNNAVEAIKQIKDQTFLLNFISANLTVKLKAKQELLEFLSPEAQAVGILRHLLAELQIIQVRSDLDSKIRSDIEKQQREFILGQQMKAIQDELGQSPQQQDLDELLKKAADKQWPPEAQQRFDKEVSRLRRTNPNSPDYSVSMNYLETLIDLPWFEYSTDNFDLQAAEEILNHDHFGMEKIKERILEYLAVLKLRNDMKAPILCLFGPPGVGKTSLGRSIAQALDRQYIRMSLGGLSDEAELRGHRKTYIGALPGRILQSLKKAGTSNPVFLLDEIDKLGNSFKGDPSSALLEILDPEQNTRFYDNYLELDYDLSKVLFIATANSLSTIQPALLDRMEIIELSGYSIEEKVHIAQRHLLPKQLKEHGINEQHVEIPAETLQDLIADYTRESGVRSLERYIARLLRWVARKVANDPTYTTTIQPNQLHSILGPKRVNNDQAEENLPNGVAVGLAWTATGGDILFIESNRQPNGKGQLTLTGNLGDVMKESATTALSFLRANAELLDIPTEILDSHNFHVHVPAGAIPKDGPSAGITMLSALASTLLQKPIRSHLAMTGEITLRGKVLPVGGIKEKILAAKRAGITDIILCHDNRADVEEIPAEYLEGILFHYVHNMHQVLQLIFLD